MTTHDMTDDPKSPRAVCVYSSSSDAVDAAFFTAAEELGRGLAQRRYRLVYGGAQVGLMGAVARGVHAGGGHVIGVLPEVLQTKEIAYALCDELVITRDLRERKALMEERADAFVVLPGGFGTLEEVFEILTLKLLGLHAKPVVLLNIDGFYDPLHHLFEHIYEHRFAKPASRTVYHFANTVPEALAYLEDAFSGA